jgi:hypothetical protein
MTVTITPHPYANQGNKRVIEHLNTETGSDRIQEMLFHYERRVYESNAENAMEIVEFRKTDKLTATNEVKVNAQGVILNPDEDGEYPEGAIGEYDFYISALFSGNFTKEQMVEMVIQQADSNHRFD